MSNIGAGPSSGSSLRDRMMAGMEQMRVSQQGAQGFLNFAEDVEGDDSIAASKKVCDYLMSIEGR